MDSKKQHDQGSLAPYLSSTGAWALALGTAIGWGSLVVTSNSYLLQAGPWGSVIGLLVGAAIMVVVGRNYHYLINCFPDSGGAYTYAKEIFGHDHGFLTAWFLGLTYAAIFWANMTSLPLFAHYFLGDMFRFGYLYAIFGYDIYLGEAMLSIVAILLVMALCLRSRVGTMRVMIVLAVLFTAGIAICGLASMSGFVTGDRTMEPLFLPDNGIVMQVVIIACISPWAFIGFENISHASEEFAFSRSKVFRIMVAAVVFATVLYVLVLLMSVSAYPPEYASWLDYISDLGNLQGIEALPPFYAAYCYLGEAGIGVLMTALFALIVSSLIGNTLAVSRLIYALGKDTVLPQRFAHVNGRHIPAAAIVLFAAISLVVPFLGRTAIGWIVDVTTLGATLVYGIVSASAAKVARARGDSIERGTGIAGIVIMIAFGVQLIVPSLFSTQSMAPESFFLFASWGILGFICFRILLSRDAQRRFGRSAVVWIALLSLVMFVTFVWMDQSLIVLENNTAEQFMAYFQEGQGGSEQLMADGAFVEAQFALFRSSSLRVILVAAALFALAAAMLLMNFSHLSRWAQSSEQELDKTRNIIYTDPLTSLPSMARFQGLAQRGAAAIHERGGHAAIVAFDLAGMKDYNAKHGRDGGDRLLCSFARVLEEHFGEGACSRFSEDHFFAYAADEGLAGKLDALFADFEEVEDGESLPVRAGVYVCESPDDIMGAAFDRARSACSRDRKTWQSHATWFVDEMDEASRMRMHVLSNVDRAIAERWIRPYYQGIVNPKTGNICAEEALCRWIDPEIGFLSPGQFIPILEESGLLHKVDMHMVDCVLQDIASKAEAGATVVPVSVNISLRDVEQVDVAGEIVRKVRVAGISQDLLQVEFTESAASESPEVFRRQVDTLRGAGFEVWMDDFGSGYSSLNSLKDFDFDLVKLDMHFISDIQNEKTWDVVIGVSRIVHTLGMRLLAEGAETEFQVERLKAAGCDMIQGYFFAKPQSLEAAIEEEAEGTGLGREAPVLS